MESLQERVSSIAHKSQDVKKKLKEGFKEASNVTRQTAELAREVKRREKEHPEERKALKEAKDELKKVDLALKPDNGNLWVRLWLGSVNVKSYREAERWNLKIEYEKYKGRTNMIFILGAITQLLMYVKPVDLLFQMWLCYYYATLALRENILKVNGSNINSWWIQHHYVSILVSVLLVTWPSPAGSYAIFRPQFGWFSLAQASIQVLLNRYQLGRLYRAKAMGKASKMDVPGEMEGVAALRHTTWSPTMAFLFPFLMFVQLFQVYNCFTLLYFAYSQRPSDVFYVTATGIFFGVLGFGNLRATLYTYVKKWGSR